MKKQAELLDARFELLLTKTEKRALERLAENMGISKGHVLRGALRTLAKRKKVWI